MTSTIIESRGKLAQQVPKRKRPLIVSLIILSLLFVVFVGDFVLLDLAKKNSRNVSTTVKVGRDRNNSSSFVEETSNPKDKEDGKCQ
jgi:hypothetical protein